MTNYFTNLQIVYNENIQRVFQERYWEITESETPEGNPVVVLGNYEILQFIRTIGLALGRITHGMESREFPALPKYTSVFDIVIATNQVINPALVYLASSFGFEELKKQPSKIIDILDTLGFCIGNLIYNSSLSTNSYSTPKIGTIYINSFVNSYIVPYINIGYQLILEKYITGDLADKLCDSIGKAMARSSYGMENNYGMPNLDLQNKTDFYKPSL